MYKYRYVSNFDRLPETAFALCWLGLKVLIDITDNSVVGNVFNSVLGNAP